MDRQSIATAIERTARRVADKIDPPEYGVKIVWDADYKTEGSYAYDSEEETREAVAEEIAKLDSGEWVAVGVVAIERNRRDGVTRETDKPADLWGIVTSSNDLPAGQSFGPVWDLSELSGYLRTVADDLISEARDPQATPTAMVRS